MERDKNVAKIWLTPIRVQSTGGFRLSKINRILMVTEENWKRYCAVGTNTVAIDLQNIRIEDVEVSDGRSLRVPLAWYPRLYYGTPVERGNWRFIGQGIGIHWSELNEDLSVEGLLLGKKPTES